MNTLSIGPILLSSPLLAAPMAGVSDLPTRLLWRKYGAGLAVSEMVSAQANLRDTQKSATRLNREDEPGPHSVQILGNDPAEMAEAAAYNRALGADIIDINLGCPAKKVCQKAAGSALLADPGLVREILQAVKDAVDCPVTLKMRTGTDPEHRNALTIAQMAQDLGFSALTLHGRTRAEAFKGAAEYDTIRQVKQALSLPVIANGDIDSPTKARAVLEFTQADGLMIGRAATGNPWLLADILSTLSGRPAVTLDMKTKLDDIATHLAGLHRLYGEKAGYRIARKHLHAYAQTLNWPLAMRQSINQLHSNAAQIEWFDGLREAILLDSSN